MMDYAYWRIKFYYDGLCILLFLQLLHLPIPSKVSMISKHSNDTQDDETSLSSDSDFADR